MVLPDALHFIRSLLSTSINTTPHERFQIPRFQRRSSCKTSLPSWLSAPGPVMLRRFVRHTKNNPFVDEVHLMDPSYAHIRYPDGRESTVSIKDLSACPAPPIAVDRDTTSPLSHMNDDITTNHQTPTLSSANYMNYETRENPVSQPIPKNGSQIVDTVISNATPVLRRSSRVTKTPNRLAY